MEDLRHKSTFTSGSTWKAPHDVKLGNQNSPRYDSGFDSLPSIEFPPQPPKLYGAAAIQEELGEESGVFSGVYLDSETDGNPAASTVPPQVMDEAVVPPSSELKAMTITNQRRDLIATVATVDKHPRQKAKGGKQVRVRRPHRNYSTASLGTSSGSRSSSPGLQSLPDNTGLGSSLSGGFSTSHTHGSQPQSWDTGFSSQPSGLSSLDVFSGSAGSMAWPTIDIFELQQNVQYFLPNRDGDT